MSHDKRIFTFHWGATRLTVALLGGVFRVRLTCHCPGQCSDNFSCWIKHVAIRSPSKSQGIGMKATFIGVAAAAGIAMATSAAGQLPPGLLGPATPPGEMHSEPFYKGPEGFWVLMRNPQNDGLNCSVNFTSEQGIFSVHGPKDAAAAKKNMGMIWMGGPNIPGPSTPALTVITVSGASPGPAQTIPVYNLAMGDRGMFIVVLDIKETLKGKMETNDLSVDHLGKNVFATKVVKLQEAYRTLGRCMAAGKKKRN